jgi:hypothetical protein
MVRKALMPTGIQYMELKGTSDVLTRETLLALNVSPVLTTIALSGNPTCSLSTGGSITTVNPRSRALSTTYLINPQ